jgi:hypothetical protein
MGDLAELEVESIPSSEVPVGLGEPATTAVAPAIGNAIFAASGARLRHLPIRPEALREVFGDAKISCRLIVGVASLPLGVSIALEVIFEVQ